MTRTRGGLVSKVIWVALEVSVCMCMGEWKSSSKQCARWPMQSLQRPVSEDRVRGWVDPKWLSVYETNVNALESIDRSTWRRCNGPDKHRGPNNVPKSGWLRSHSGRLFLPPPPVCRWRREREVTFICFRWYTFYAVLCLTLIHSNWLLGGKDTVNSSYREPYCSWNLEHSTRATFSPRQKAWENPVRRCDRVR